MCQLKDLEIMKETVILRFNVNRWWLQKFFKQINFCGRKQQTSSAHRPPNVHEEKLFLFQSTCSLVCNSNDDINTDGRSSEEHQ
jgi:hypothetical protein